MVDWRKTHCAVCGKRTRQWEAGRKANGTTVHFRCENKRAEEANGPRNPYESSVQDDRYMRGEF